MDLENSVALSSLVLFDLGVELPKFLLKVCEFCLVVFVNLEASDAVLIIDHFRKGVYQVRVRLLDLVENLILDGQVSRRSDRSAV